MTSSLRRIDLTTKILAPVATGQIMTYAGLENGALFIGSWNLVSVFAEYFLVWKVYNAVPALKKKKDKCKSDSMLFYVELSGTVFCLVVSQSTILGLILQNISTIGYH